MTQGKEKNLKHIFHAIINKFKIKDREKVMFETKKKQSKSGIKKEIIIGLIVIILAVAGYYFAGKKDKKEIVEQNNTAQESKQNINLDKDIKKADNQAVNDEKYIFLPYEYVMYDTKGNITYKSLFTWDYYNNPVDFKVSYKSILQNNSYKEISIEKKNNTGKISNKTFMYNSFNEDLSYTDIVEYYDNSSAVLKLEQIKGDGEKVPNSLVAEKNQQVDLVRMIDILDKSNNTLKKIQVLNDGTRKESIYINNEMRSLTEFKDYYYNDILVTTLYRIENYSNNKLGYVIESKVENVKQIDENTVQVNMIQETSKDNQIVIDYKSAYILSKYVLGKNGKVTLAGKEK